MINHSRHLALLAMIAAGLLPVTSAQAQYDRSSNAQPAPLYPYAVQGNQPHAVEVAPNTYGIRRPATARAYPYVSRRAGQAALNRPHNKADRALIEELRRRAPLKRTGRDDNKMRVIQADAEITIIGPDRMSIRLFRKGHGSKASTRAE